MRPTQIKSDDGCAKDPFLYQSVVELIRNQMNTGTLRAGDKLPSLRKLSTEMRVSVPTVRQAYLELERQGRIEARAKSGYFVLARSMNELVRKRPCAREPVTVSCRALMDEVNDGMHKPGVLPLGVASPTMALPAVKTLNRAMKRVMSRAEDRVFSYAPTSGEPGLRRQLAYRYLNMGGEVDPDDIIITNGAQEGLALALQSVAGPGDIIAVESPTYHGQLELIETLGMLALRIDTCPERGVDLEALEDALKSHKIAACMFSATINNPLGSRMPDENKKKLVRLIESHGVPLIEDDVYGDLVFDGPRPAPAQFYSKKDLVITCSSFSKTVAPGYRTGWIIPGKFTAEVKKRKRAVSHASGLLQQLTMAEFIGSGDFDRYLQRLIVVLRDNAQRMAGAICQMFPSDVRVSRPKGGSVLWVNVPGLDSVELFHEALERNISVTPGTLFAARNRYRSFLRLSFGHPWTPELEDGLQVLGNLVEEVRQRR